MKCWVEKRLNPTDVTMWNQMIKLPLWMFVVNMVFTPVLHAQPMLYAAGGQHIPFSTLRGKWVFIQYWASWCESCLAEISELNHFYAKQKQNNMALFAVNYDMLPVEMQSQLVLQYHIQYPTLVKDPAQSLKLGDIRGVPVTFVFDPEGHLSRTLYGKQTEKTFSALIQ